MRELAKISDFLDGRNNNFNLIRFLAATAVIFSHAWVMIASMDVIQPLFKATGYALGDLAVNIFFILSGFLVTQSIIHRNSLADYAIARGLRIFPALIAVAIVTALIIGPLMTAKPVSEYFASLDTWIYIAVTSLSLPDFPLPGVFETAPTANKVNEPIWTLRYELVAYIGLAGLWLVGLLKTKTRFTFVLLAGVGVYFALTIFTSLRAEIAAVDHLSRFALCFLFGISAYIYRHHIPLHWGIVALLLVTTVLVKETTYYQFFLILFMAYTCLAAAYLPGGLLRSFNRLGDYSYGLYIYGWPMAQGAHQLFPQLNELELFAVSFAGALAGAIVSWHLIERWALSWKIIVITRLHARQPAAAK